MSSNSAAPFRTDRVPSHSLAYLLQHLRHHDSRTEESWLAVTDARVRHYIAPKELSSFFVMFPKLPRLTNAAIDYNRVGGDLRFSPRLIVFVHGLPAGTLRNAPNESFQLFPRPRAVVVRFFLHLLAG